MKRLLIAVFAALLFVSPILLSIAEARGSLEPGVSHTVEVEPKQGNPILGAAEPMVIIHYWVSYRVAYNHEASRLLDKLLENHPNDVRVVVHHRSRGHDLEEDAIAEIAREVYIQGGKRLFWRFHKRLVNNPHPHTLKKEDAIKLAVSMGLSKNALERGVQRNSHSESITKSTFNAFRMGVYPGTSSVMFLINTTLVYIGRSTKLSYLERIVSGERARALKVLKDGMDIKDLPKWSWRAALKKRRSTYRSYRNYQRSWWRSIQETQSGSRIPVERHRIPVEGVSSKGSPRAEVTVVLFADPLNTNTKVILDTLDTLMKNHDRKITLALRLLPGFGVNRGAELARTVLAAEKQGAAWIVLEKILQLRYGFRTAILKAGAKSKGLDLKKLEEDKESPEVKARLSEDVGLAYRLGVYKGPAVFINGIEVKDGNNSSTIRIMLRAILKSELQPGLLSKLVESEER